MPKNEPISSNPPTKLRLGTRGSALARWQADWVAQRLRELGSDVELVFIKTDGDGTTTPITVAGGQGLFTKEIQKALLDERIDLAVHSLKDLPTETVTGLTLAAVPQRESPLDVFVSNEFASVEQLSKGARIGTGSRRRQSQLLHSRPDLQVRDIRGNVDTRLRKLDEGEFDAIILAEAGLKRLDLQQRIAQVIPPEVMLPAVGQGALGLETRRGEDSTIAAVARLDDGDTHAAVVAERVLLAALRAGCLAPVGAWARVAGAELKLDAVVLSPDGSKRIAAATSGALDSAETIGEEAARQLLEQGADSLIAESRH